MALCHQLKLKIFFPGRLPVLALGYEVSDKTALDKSLQTVSSITNNTAQMTGLRLQCHIFTPHNL